MLAPSRLPAARNAHTRRRSASPGSDVKFHTAFDERWRQVATFRGSDANPKEQFVYHCAGNGGWGGSSYIDSVLLRDRDMTNGWTGAADGTLEERVYLLQNWRADVVAIVEPDGDGGATMVEWIKYSAYGVPFALPAGDTDSDGDCDSTDDAQVTTWKNAPAYDVRGDLNLDGVIDATDESLVVSAHQSLGRGVLTSTAVGNRKGYAGYEGDAKLSAKWHVRHREFDSALGRWLSRDPMGYVDSLSFYQAHASSPVVCVDSSGLIVEFVGSGKQVLEALHNSNMKNQEYADTYKKLHDSPDTHTIELAEPKDLSGAYGAPTSVSSPPSSGKPGVEVSGDTSTKISPSSSGGKKAEPTMGDLARALAHEISHLSDFHDVTHGYVDLEAGGGEPEVEQPEVTQPQSGSKDDGSYRPNVYRISEKAYAAYYFDFWPQHVYYWCKGGPKRYGPKGKLTPGGLRAREFEKRVVPLR